ITVETEATTTGVNTWETLECNFANQVDGTAELNMANTYDKASILFDFGNAGTGKTYLWDDVLFVTEPTVSFDLPVDFEEAVTLVDFGGTASTQVADPTDANNMVAQSIKTDGAATYAGTTLNGDDGFDTAIPFSVSSKTISVRVYSPDANTVVRLKVEDASNAGITVETEATTTGVNTWETLEFNFANQADGTAELNMANTYDKASIFFDFGNAGTGKTYLWDDVLFGAAPAPTGPTTAPEAPACDANNVISLFSDAYTDETVDTWRTPWSNDAVALMDITIANNAVKLYENLGHVGVETATSTIDATDMTHFHIDIWTPNMTAFKIKLVDFGANGVYEEENSDNSEHEITISNPAQSEWVSISIPLADFGGLTSRAHLAQYIFVSEPYETGTVYIDNVYFSKDCVVDPTPTSAVTFAVDMNSHSGTFTTVYVSGTFNNWSGDANSLSDVDGDGVWTGTMEMEHGEHEYKFTLDNWAAQENLTSGSDCTVTNDGFTNRAITVSGSAEFCFTWETCDACTCAYLVWSDEFDGAALDLNKWTPQIGTGSGGWGNQELQYYRAENTTVADGKLTITAKNEVFNGSNYTSSRLRTIDKGDWKYGRFEASIKLPIGQGIWPAFWMMPTDDAYGTWPRSGEIDIMELLGHKPEEVFGTIHFGSSFETRRFIGNEYQLPSGNFNEDFHVFAIEWEENAIRWYVDDVLYATRTADEISPDNWPFDQRFHFILNVAVGGSFPGSPDGTTVFPQAMEVDYVRVYKGVFPSLTGGSTTS
ncbi:MAG: family 16 glycosylhydrolase, partial [Saprospiraceae bacterium]